MSTNFKARIRKVIFEKDGYIIAATDKKRTVKGNIHHASKELVGVDIEFSGKWVENKNYGGEDFSFNEYRIKTPFSLLFLHKIVGLPEKSAKLALDKFGDKLEDIIEKDPKQLLSIKGIGEAKLQRITSMFQENKGIHALAEFLAPLGVSINRIRKIQDFYKTKNKNAIREIKNNPYILTRMSGVGFKSADKLAMELEHDPASLFRISQGIIHAMQEYIDEKGNTYVDKTELFKTSSELLNIESSSDNEGFSLDFSLYEKALSSLLADGKQIKMVRDDLFSSIKIYEAEKKIYDTVMKYANHSHGTVLSDKEIEAYIQNAEQEKGDGFKFGSKQKDGIRLANKRYAIFYLYGLAGSGKTTTSKDSLDLLSSMCTSKDRIVVTSLSGVAANRAKTVTGYTGKTIHSLLGYDPEGGWLHTAENKLDYDVIMLDECSMVDSMLFSALIDAIDFTKTTLMLVGDPAQLQSIGAGDVYKNIIESGVCHGVGLDQVFRQKDDQYINIFATEYIRQGKMLEGHKRELGDFVFKDISIPNGFKLRKEVSDDEWNKYRKENNERILNQIIYTAKIYKNNIEYLKKHKAVGKYMSYFQAISPQKAGVLGVENLNIELQKIFNPEVAMEGENSKKIIATATGKYGFFDKVIHLKNKNMVVASASEYKQHKNNFYDFIKSKKSQTRVFNGQIGVVFDIHTDKNGKQFASVFYPNENYIAVYSKADFSSGLIQLSYAMSIHKSQGSEFDIVTLPVSYSHYMMLNNQLFYTAFTRAKNKLYVLGEEGALKRGATNVKDTKRNTILSLYFSVNKDGGQHIESAISPINSGGNGENDMESEEKDEGIEGIRF